MLHGLYVSERGMATCGAQQGVLLAWDRGQSAGRGAHQHTPHARAAPPEGGSQHERAAASAGKAAPRARALHYPLQRGP